MRAGRERPALRRTEEGGQVGTKERRNERAELREAAGRAGAGRAGRWLP